MSSHRTTAPLARIAPIAFWAAVIGPIQNLAGWAIAGALWPGYDPVRLTISDLASPESPVRWVMTSFFILGSTLTLIAALFARTLALPGRIVLFIAAICSYGLTVFPTPFDGVSVTHRLFATGFFAASASWPIFAMRVRRDAPWVVRPLMTSIGTAVQAVFAISFLIVWSDPTATNVGVWERVVSFQQAAYLSGVVIVCWVLQRRAAAASASLTPAE